MVRFYDLVDQVELLKELMEEACEYGIITAGEYYER